MLRIASTLVLASMAVLSMCSAPADATTKKKPLKKYESVESRQARASVLYRGGTRVRGFTWRRVGGYSYAAEDSINTYGDSQSRYSYYSLFRNQDFGRQSSSGPFDSDFFFDSGISPRGGNSPYPN